MQIPVIGMAPLRNLDQISGLVVFLAFQVIQFCEQIIKTKKLQKTEAMKCRVKLLCLAFSISLTLVTVFVPSSHFVKISPGIEAIFAHHLKPEKPHVNSSIVTEHDPTDWSAFYKFLHFLCISGTLGFITVLLCWSDAASFLITYAALAYFLSYRTQRLLFLLGPIASILSGIFIGRLTSHLLYKICELDSEDEERMRREEECHATLVQSVGRLPTCTNAKKTKYWKNKNNFARDHDHNSSSFIMMRTVAYFLALFILVHSSVWRYCDDIRPR
jgi:hypothetical protein